MARTVSETVGFVRTAAVTGMAVALVAGIGCGSGDANSATMGRSGPADQATAAKKKRKKAANWPTYHADLARTAVDRTSPPLRGPRRIWSRQLDGQVYAEPLAVGNRVYAATENNTVYALNAANGKVAWKRHLGTPVDATTLPCGNIMPVTGITGTPAISDGVLYAVAFLSGYRHVLFGLRLRGGKVQMRRAVDAPGSDPRVHQERSALSVSHGRVYVEYGGLTGDCGPYRGRVISVKAEGKARTKVFTVGVNREGGIWAPSGAGIDRKGNVFVATGNGDSPSSFDFGNSVIRLTPKLKQTSFWRPTNADELNRNDTDLGSVGPALLGGGRVFAIGKEGVGVTLSTSNLGGIGGQLFQASVCSGGAYGGTAYLPPLLFVPCTDGLVALRISGSSFSTAWSSASFNAGPPIIAGGAVWSIDTGSGTLTAFAPDSGQVLATQSLGSVTHFATPSAGGGRLFAPASDQIVAFGGV
jgi:outer membrane protein assembly factor BamB